MSEMFLDSASVTFYFGFVLGAVVTLGSVFFGAWLVTRGDR